MKRTVKRATQRVTIYAAGLAVVAVALSLACPLWAVAYESAPETAVLSPVTVENVPTVSLDATSVAALAAAVASSTPTSSTISGSVSVAELPAGLWAVLGLLSISVAFLGAQSILGRWSRGF